MGFVAEEVKQEYNSPMDSIRERLASAKSDEEKRQILQQSYA